MWRRDCALWGYNYKDYADIRGGSLDRGHQMRVFFSFCLAANSCIQSVAVLTTWCQVSLSLAFLHAVWTPKFRGWTSSSIVLSQVARGWPTGLLQSVGGLRAAAMTRWWSSSGAERSRCPKNLTRKDFTLSETGKHPVILRTVSLVMCLVYGIRRIFCKHQVSKALRRFTRVLVTVHVSHP